MKASSEGRKCRNRSGSPFRKKSKKLAAICEDEYTKNHGETKQRDGGSGFSGADSELRRSSRVRKAPVVLDSSPQPPKKRKRTGSSGNGIVNRSTQRSSGSVKKEESNNLDTLSVWKSRLRSSSRNVGFQARERQLGAVSRRRKLFDSINASKSRDKVVVREMKGNHDVRNGEKKDKPKRSVKVGESESSEDSVKQSDGTDNEYESESDSAESTECESEAREEDERDDVDKLAVVESQNETETDRSETEDESEAESTDTENEDRDEGRECETEGKGTVNEVETIMDEMEAETNARVEVEEDETGLRVEGMKNDEVDLMDSKMGSDNENGKLDANGNLIDKVWNGKGDVLNPELIQQVCIENNRRVEQNDDQIKLLDCDKELEHEQDDIPVRTRSTHNMEEDKKFHDRGENDSANKVVDSICPSTERLSKSRFKQGRRCGLCGVGMDGKPPKKLMEDYYDSDIEARSGSSASEESNYDIWDGFGDDPGWLGRLLGPINDRYGIAGTWVHQHCAVWSPEVYFAGLGCLKNVRAALCRGRSLKCTRCGRPGATIGCRVDRCPKTYHLPCARANGCIFDHRKFLIACTDHRHIFQPYGRQCQARIKKMKAKRMKLQMRKLSNDAWREDVEAEEKWFEKCGEDEEFLKRESKRLHRDLLRVAPVYIGGSDSESGKSFEGWDSVAGLEGVVQCMKEVVILPLLYPEFFDNLGLAPPRGVLLHGHPGTGKTLVVRALIGSLARGDKRIAYFARKGADCLGKYVGDAERQLRLLFQVAERSQPSIIFFDEIDGLAPKRLRQQDQTHISVVSTLLALLDGLKSRGSVVVIGATNRPDAIDPALRRPGRFDREIYFPLPSLQDRAAIISLHTKKWPKPVSGSLLKWIARETVGFAGADLQALCTQAAIIALKRNFPLQESMTSAQLKVPGAKRLALPDFSVEERDWLEALLCSPPPCSHREAGMVAGYIFSSPLPIHLVPSLLRPLCFLLVAFHLEERIWLPPILSKAAAEVKYVILSALDNRKMTNHCWWSHVHTLLQQADVVEDMIKKLSYAGIVDGGCYTAGSDASSAGAGVCSEFDQPVMRSLCARAKLLGNFSLQSRSKSGFLVLIAGGPKSGQRHLASCILHCFIGNTEVQKIDMATISQEGNGDLVQGLTHLLIKCASMKSCVLFMPRIDLWALEKAPLFEDEVHEEVDNKDDFEKESSFPSCAEISKQDHSFGQQCETEETIELQSACQVSCAWNTFVEQVESLRGSMTVMVLATSGLPYGSLPDKIRQFFKIELSKDDKQISSQAVHQFVVQVGENFDHEMAINLSVMELSRQAIQLFVHLLHQRAHTRDNLCEEYIRDISAQSCRVSSSQHTSHGSGEEAGDKSKFPDNCSTGIPQLSISRNVKAKSSLQYAVSAFGYQILQYPHFAELCWVTSKLTEGPSADVSGPWRGWPFNSCIIRPCNSSEETVAAAGFTNIKGKESSGLVRGLIAVGLSAYRGNYASPKEVSFEVRKVLELLVGRINIKVNSGKGRYRYARILSQVAYLEDLVNSWAYALRSFKPNALMELTNPRSCYISNLSAQNEKPEQNVPIHGCPGSNGLEENLEECAKNTDRPNKINIDGNLDAGGVTCMNECSVSTSPTDDQPLADMPNGHSGKTLEPCGLENAGTLTAQNSGCLNLDEGNGDVVSSLVGIVAVSGKGSTQQTVLDLNSPAFDLEQAGTHPGPRELETAGITSASEGKADSQNNPRDSGNSSAFRFSEFLEACNQSVNEKTEAIKQSEGLDFSSSENVGHVDDPNSVCLYRCCSQCLFIVQDLILKLITRASGLGTAEDVHDAVASLSVELIAAVRKFIVVRNRGTAQEENSEHENCRMQSGCSQFPETNASLRKRSGDNVIASAECCCHSAQGSFGEANTGLRSKSWFDPVFLFRDGIVVPVDTEEDLLLHCKFESFCLGSLIEAISNGVKRLYID